MLRRTLHPRRRRLRRVRRRPRLVKPPDPARSPLLLPNPLQRKSPCLKSQCRKSQCLKSPCRKSPCPKSQCLKSQCLSSPRARGCS